MSTPDTGAGPRSLPAGWAAAIGLLAVLALSLLTVADLAPPAPAPATAPAGEFSAERAQRHIEQIARAPHPMGSEEHTRVREYLVAELRDLGLEPEVQEAVGVSPEEFGGAASVGRVHNVSAVIEGTAPTGRIVLAAHYDSVPSGPGAADDGAGVAAILEAARALQAGGPPENDVVLLLTDGEERGLLGADAFIDDHPLAEDGGTVLNHEARGSSGAVTMFRTTEEGSELVRTFGAAAPYPVADSASATLFGLLPNDTDFTVFSAGGLTGMDFAFIGDSANYHGVLDSPENVDPGSLQQMGANTVALTRALGGQDLGAAGSGEELAYFNVPPNTLVGFPAWWALPLAGAALAAAVGAVARARRRAAVTLPGVLAGAGLGVLLIAAGAAAAMLYWQGLVAARPGFGLMETGTPYRPAWFQGALLLVAAALAATWYAVSRRWIGPHGLALGALLVLALAGAAVAGAAPEASMPLVLPALGAALAGLLVPPSGGTDTPWRPAAAALGLAPAAVFLLAGAWLDFEAGLETGAYLAMLRALLGALLLLPLAGFLWPRRRAFLVPLVALAAAGAATAAGLAVNPLDRTQPVPAMLTYTLDADSGEARWAAPVRPGRPPGPLDAWTSRYVGEELGEDPTPSLGWPQARTGEAEAAPLDAPELDVRKDAEQDGRRTLDLAVSTVRGAEAVGLSIPEEAAEDVRMTVEGREIAPLPDRTGMLGFRFYAPPEDGTVEVRIETAAGGAPLPVRIADFDSLPSALEDLPGYTAPPDDRYLILSRVSVTREYEV